MILPLSVLLRGTSSGIVPTGGSNDERGPMIGLIPEVLEVEFVLLRETSVWANAPAAGVDRDAVELSNA